MEKNKDGKEKVKTPQHLVRRSFYIDDSQWYPFQSKLWKEQSNASRWIREMITWYLEED